MAKRCLCWHNGGMPRKVRDSARCRHPAGGPASATGEPLSGQLVRVCGWRAIAPQGVGCLYRAAIESLKTGDTVAAFERWLSMAGAAWGGKVPLGEQIFGSLARRCGLQEKPLRPDVLLFCVQTYLALVARLLAGHAWAWARREPSPLEAIAGRPGSVRSHRLLRAHLYEGPLAAALAGGNRVGLAGPADCCPPDPCSPAHARAEKPDPVEVFSWPLGAWNASMAELAGRLAGAMLCLRPQGPAQNPWADGDVLGPLAQQLLPRKVRHLLGQYFTPRWLAEHVLDQAGYLGRPEQRVLDPTCGSGVFLLAALRRIRVRRNQQQQTGARPACRDVRCALPGPVPEVLQNVVGLELDPAALLAARVNYLLAVADWLSGAETLRLPVLYADVLDTQAGRSVEAHEQGDSLMQPELREFDLVVGNPPWIAWDNLSEAMRRATAPLWRRYGLFTLSATDARHGGAKKDLAMLVMYVCADRYLRGGGRLAMVVPQSVFQTRGAGEGFRRFWLGTEGEPLCVLRVDDLARLRPFAGATNLTATIVLEKGSPTQYPVPYVRWLPGEDQSSTQHHGPGLSPNVTATLDKPVRLERCVARPVDPSRPGAPWLVRPVAGRAAEDEPRFQGPSDYRAYLGANTGGANGVYWFELVGLSSRGTVRVRNLAECGRAKLGSAVHELEPDLLYPLLRWGDVGSFRAQASAWILLVQDPDRRTGIDQKLLQARWPRTFAYLCRHEQILRKRAALRRYQQGRPFYSMYNVGPYTLAPVKVLWRRMDRHIRAAVVEPVEFGPFGSRPVVPQETCVLIPCQCADEAHYLCALLNSSPVGRMVEACSVRGGKSFGTPAILQVLGLRRFDTGRSVHRELAALSRQAHALANQQAPLAEIRRRIDTLASRALKEQAGESG